MVTMDSENLKKNVRRRDGRERERERVRKKKNSLLWQCGDNVDTKKGIRTPAWMMCEMTCFVRVCNRGTSN